MNLILTDRQVQADKRLLRAMRQWHWVEHESPKSSHKAVGYGSFVPEGVSPWMLGPVGVVGDAVYRYVAGSNKPSGFVQNSPSVVQPGTFYVPGAPQVDPTLQPLPGDPNEKPKGLPPWLVPAGLALGVLVLLGGTAVVVKKKGSSAAAAPRKVLLGS
jgi:hypothetical protein